MSFFLFSVFYILFEVIGMIQVKCFVNEDLKGLEEEINEFLVGNKELTVFDYKYEVVNKIEEIEGEEEIVVDQVLLYTCLLMYCIKSI